MLESREGSVNKEFIAKRQVDLVVNNGFGFGGINSVTVFAIPED